MSIAPSTLRAYRASLLHFHADPAFAEHAYSWFEDGLLIVDGGVIVAAGDYARLRPTLADGVDIVDYSGKIICPGFIDTHIHFPQTYAGDSYGGGQLLEWLNLCIFPSESKFADPAHSNEVADVFFDELLRFFPAVGESAFRRRNSDFVHRGFE